jgi:RsmE family RNA methyltransferase
MTPNKTDLPVNLILIKPAEIKGDIIILAGRRSRHIRRVLRANINDTVRVGVINGRMGVGLITAIGGEQITLRLTLTEEPPPPPLIDLILALPRPIMLKRILVQAVTMGVNHLYLINAGRVEKSFFSASLLKDGGWREYLLQGLEQAVDTRLPGLTIWPRFRPFIEDVLPDELAAVRHRFVAHPVGPPLKINGAGDGRLAVAIGPEGGWVDFEIEKFREAGFQVFSLGSRIMRVDTAVPAIMAQINMQMDTRVRAIASLKRSFPTAIHL